VLPSAYEAFSLAALEAAASALPVVMTRVGVASTIVGHNEGGILVDRTASSIAEALGRLAGDPGLRRQMGATARRRVSALTWDASADVLRGIYHELLRERNSAVHAAG
jgi:D-inositol-3-phosphate glycosyltransferase